MINCIVGAGILGLPSQVYALTGPYSLLAFLCCAVVVTLIAFCFAEVASRFTETGGAYLYARETFGPVTAFEVGWLTWIARLSSFAAISNVLVSYASFYWPPADSGLWRALLIAGPTVALTSINLAGIRETTTVNNLLTAGKLIPLFLFAAAGLFFIDLENYRPAAPLNASAFSLAVSQLVFAYTGFDLAVITAGEMRDPRRNLPFAIVVAIAVVALLYILIQTVCIGTLPQLEASQKPLVDASSRFLGPAGVSVISAGAILSGLGTMNAILLAGSRVLFAMGERNELPRFLSITHPKFRTPHVSILITAGVALTMSVSGTFTYMLTIGVIAKLIAFMATCGSLLVLRARNTLPASFILPGGRFVAVLSLALCVWLLFHSGWPEIRAIGIACAVGFLIHAVSRQAVR